MCGVAGFQFSPTSSINARELARVLLLNIQSRGREATGYAYFDVATGDIKANNLNAPAKDFIKNPKAFRLDAHARTVILHTRLATQGSPKNPKNNHPVLAYDGTATVAAVHNGSVANDSETFIKYDLDRHAEVDSEVIAAMVARYGSDQYYKIFHELEGGIATAWLDERTPGILHCVRGEYSPMFVAALADVETPTSGRLTGTIIASTVSALSDALKSLGVTWATAGVDQYNINEGQRFIVEGGVWDRTVYPIQLPERATYYYGAGGGKLQKFYGTGYAGSWEGWDADTGTTFTGGKSSLGDNLDDELDVADEYPSLFSASVDDFDAANSAILAEAGWGQDEHGTWLPDRRKSTVADQLDRTNDLDALADRLTRSGYILSGRDLVLLSTVTPIEENLHGIKADLVSAAYGDLMVHAVSCSDTHCVLGWEYCPLALLEGTAADHMVDAFETVAERWGLAVPMVHA